MHWNHSALTVAKNGLYIRAGTKNVMKNIVHFATMNSWSCANIVMKVIVLESVAEIA